MRTRKHPRQRGEAVTRAPRGERRRGGGGESRAAHLSPGKRATTKGRNLPSTRFRKPWLAPSALHARLQLYTTKDAHPTPHARRTSAQKNS